MPYPKYVCLLLICFVVGLSARAQGTNAPELPDKLVVAWVENSNLFAWTSTGGARQLVDENVVVPFLAPDGEHIAFTRGADGFPDSIWLTGTDGGEPRQLVTIETLPADDDVPLLMSQLAWFDSSTLYFNTARHNEIGQDRRDDLWKVNIDSGEAAMLLPPGEGGAFSLSPDRQYIAVTNPGIYDGTDGFIRIISAQTANPVNTLSFPAVSTGSEYRFYPEAFWEADSSALRVAIPDKDLIYDEEGSPPVALWRLKVDGAQAQIGTADASFFGLPRWSSDASFIAYLQRVGDQTSNQFDLMLGDGDGKNAVTYASGQAGSIGVPEWLPDSTQFIYPAGDPGEYWLGSPDTAPSRLPHNMYNPRFLEGERFVFATALADKFELRYARLSDPTSALIATVNIPIPAFDVMKIDDE